MNGALASPFLAYKRAAFLTPRREPVAFTSELMRKDLSLAEELAARPRRAAAGGRGRREACSTRRSATASPRRTWPVS